MSKDNTKSMDDLEFNLQMTPSDWKATYSVDKKVIMSIAGNKKLVTFLQLDSTELAGGDVMELIEEINHCLDARGYGYVVGAFPQMISVVEVMRA
jgi:hypothetical protein